MSKLSVLNSQLCFTLLSCMRQYFTLNVVFTFVLVFHNATQVLLSLFSTFDFHSGAR